MQRAYVLRELALLGENALCVWHPCVAKKRQKPAACLAVTAMLAERMDMHALACMRHPLDRSRWQQHSASHLESRAVREHVCDADQRSHLACTMLTQRFTIVTTVTSAIMLTCAPTLHLSLAWYCEHALGHAETQKISTRSCRQRLLV